MGGVTANVDASLCGGGAAATESPAPAKPPAHRMNTRLQSKPSLFADWSFHRIIYPFTLPVNYTTGVVAVQAGESDVVSAGKEEHGIVCPLSRAIRIPKARPKTRTRLQSPRSRGPHTRKQQIRDGPPMVVIRPLAS